VKRDADETPDSSRREVVFLLGSAAAASMFGCGDGTSPATPLTPSSSLPAATGSTGASCIVRPQQTEGPYFVDERLNRSDIRSDPRDGSLRLGVPLRLAFRISRLAGGTCSALAGALVDVWHCDALGVYSDVQDASQGFDTRGQKFLRGYQLTDVAGAAQFSTIYPGWYPGRTVHIHFKVRTSPNGASGTEFTSQLYFDEAVTDRVYSQAPYNSKGRRTTSNQGDGIYQGGGSQLLLPLMAEGEGYGASFDIALQL